MSRHDPRINAFLDGIAPAFPEAACYGQGALYDAATKASATPGRPRHVDPPPIAKARAICKTCPHQQPCLDWALDTKQSGFIGGTTAVERNRLRRNR